MSDNNEQVHQQLQDALQNMDNRNGGGDGSGGDDHDDEDHEPENGFIGETVDVLGSDNPDNFLNVNFDDDMDIVLDEIVEVGIVGEEDEEDMVGLWEE